MLKKIVVPLCVGMLLFSQNSNAEIIGFSGGAATMTPLGGGTYRVNCGATPQACFTVNDQTGETTVFLNGGNIWKGWQLDPTNPNRPQPIVPSRDQNGFATQPVYVSDNP